MEVLTGIELPTVLLYAMQLLDNKAGTLVTIDDANVELSFGERGVVVIVTDNALVQNITLTEDQFDTLDHTISRTLSTNGLELNKVYVELAGNKYLPGWTLPRIKKLIQAYKNNFIVSFDDVE